MQHQALTIVELVKAALAEDVGPGDLTSLACLEPNPVQGKIIAKSDGVLSGSQVAGCVFQTVDSANRLEFVKQDGDRFRRGDVVATIDGFNQTVLTSERVALNFLGRLSGVASLTRQLVDRIEAQKLDRRCHLLDTRKTTPGWRTLEKAAVVHGGGQNHRMGLYDMILIKDNHIASAGSIAVAVELAREYMQTPDFRLQFDTDVNDVLIEVEVQTEAQLTEAIETGVDRIMLDNRSIDELARMVELARGRQPLIQLEASGNVALDTIADIAATGVDFISVGSITHSAPSSDFTLLLDES